MKKSKLLTLGLLAGAGLLLSINQAQAADTWVLGITSMVLVKCRQAGSKTAILGIH